MAELSVEVDRLAEEAGRDPATILRASSLSLSDSDGDITTNIEAMATAGVGYLVCGWPGEGADRVEHFATRIMPDFVN